MTKSQIDFDDEESEIIDCCKYLHKLSKPQAIKKLVRVAGEFESIKKILNEKRKIKK